MSYDIEKRFQNYMAHCFPHLNEKQDARQISDLWQIWCSCAFEVSSVIRYKLATAEEVNKTSEKLCNEIRAKLRAESET